MTDEQVEAAAKAGWDYENIDRSWKDTPEDIKSAHRARARDMLEAAEAVAWSSDMDAAPKDQIIDLYRPTAPDWCKVAPGKWDSQEFHKKPRPYWAIWLKVGDVIVSRAWEPTHWRHLHKPPNSTSAESAA